MKNAYARIVLLFVLLSAYTTSIFGIAVSTPTATVSPNPVCPSTAVSLIATGIVPGGQGSNTSGVLNLSGGAYANITTNTALQTPGDFTYEMWIRPTSLYSLNTFFENGYWNGQTTLLRMDAATTINLYISGNTIGSLTWAPTVNVWTHIALVRSGGTISFYANGTLVGNFTTTYSTAITPTTNLRIGSSQHATGQYFTGQIDEFRLWKGVALSTTTMDAWRCQELTSSHPNWANLSCEFKFNGDYTDAKGICTGAAASTTFTAPNAYTYTWTGTGAPAASTSEVQTTTTSPSGTYTVVASASGYTNSASSAPTATLTFNTTPSITSATIGVSGACSNGTTITANGVGGTGATVTWWSATGGTGTNYGTGNTITGYPGFTYYARVTGTCAGAAEALAGTVTGETTAPVIGTNTVSMNSVPGNSCKGVLTNYTASGVTDACSPAGIINVVPTSAVIPSGAKLWLKSDVGVVISSGSSVSQWQDQSGNGNNFTSSTTQPTVVTNVINGKPVIRFTTAPSYMTGGNFTSTSYTIIAVTKMAGTGNARLVSSQNVNWLMGYWGGSMNQFHANAWVTAAGGTTSDAVPHMYVATSNGGTNALYNNGALVASNSNGLAAPGVLELNGWSNGSEPSNGDIAEVIYYDRALSATELAQLQSYIGTKYAIPYNTTATFVTGPKIWIKADAGIVRGSDGTVSRWKDISGYGNDFTSPATANNPTYVANQINGQPVIRFTTAPKYMTGANLTATGYTMFAVAKMTGTANARLISSQNINWLMGYHNGTMYDYYFNGWVYDAGTTADANPHLFVLRNTGSASTVYGDGIRLASNAAGVSAPGVLELNGYGASTEMSNGDIAELIYFDRVLTDLETEQIAAYLASKYNLPAIAGTNTTLANLQAAQTYSNGTVFNVLGTDVSGNTATGTTSAATVTAYPGPVVATPTTTCVGQNITMNITNMAPVGQAASCNTNAGNEYFAANVPTGSNWTVQTWFKYPVPTNSGSWNTFLRGPNQHHIIISQNSGNGIGALGVYNGGAFYPSGFNVTQLSSGWHHLATVGTGGRTIFYIDGVRVGVSFTQVTENISAIGNYQGGGQTWGVFDETSVWNTVLSQDNIVQYMTRPASANPNYAANCVSYYKWEGNGTDSKGSNTATATSGATYTTTGMYTYTWSGPGSPTFSPAASTTNESITVTSPSAANSGNYTVYATANGCNSTTTTIPVTLNQVVLGTLSTTGPINFCDGDGAGNFQTPITVTGYTGTPVWDYGSNNGTWNLNWATGPSSPTSTFPKKISNSDNTADRIRLRMTAANCADVTSPTILIQDLGNAAPTSLASNINNVCNNVASGTLTATFPTVTNMRGTIRFYQGGSSCSGGTLIGSVAGNATTTVSTSFTPVTGTTNYYVVYDPGTGSNCSVSACASTTVTLYALPPVPTSVSSSSTAICQGNAITLTATSAGSTAINWYTSASGGSIVATSTSGVGVSYTPPSAGTFTYYAEAVNATPCSSLSRTATAAVTVTAIPAAPTAVTATPNTVCSGSSANLNATSAGNTISWYTVASGGSSIGSSASGANFAVTPSVTTTYYAEALAASLCPSTSRTAVTVTVQTLANAPAVSVSPTTICAGNTVSLTASGLVPGGQGSNSSGVLNLSGGAYVNVANGTALQTPGDFTYEMWVRPTSYTSNNTFFENGTWGGQTTLFRMDNTTTIALYINSTAVGTITYAPPLNVWTHLALVRSGSTISLYANGLFIGNFTTSFSTAASPTTALFIGSSQHTTGQYWIGQIDEFRLWKGVALPVATMNTWRNIELTSSHPNWASLSCEYKFNGTLADSRGVSATGTAVNSAGYTAPNSYTYTWSGSGAPAASTNEVQTATPATTGATYTTIASLSCYISSPASAATAAVTVNPTPAAPTSVTATPGTVCQGSSVNLNATSAGNTIRWWNAATSGTNLGSSASGADFSATPGTVPTTTYYAEAFTGLSCPSATRTAVNVTVNATSVGGTVGSNGTICSGSQPAANLTLTGNTGSVVKWQSATDAAFTTNLTDINVASTTLTPAQIGALTTTTYFRAVVQNGICPAVNSSNYVTITVNALPAISSITSSQALPMCAGSTTVLTANGVGGTGATVSWYTGAGGTGTLLGTGLTLTAGGNQTYYARVTGSCTPAVETSLNVTLETTAPTAVSATTITLNSSPNNSCKGAGVFGAITATDNCGSQATGTVNVVPTSGLVLWTKADAGVVVDGNGYVAEWRDLSGSGNNFVQPVFGSRPQLVSNVINGQPVIRMSTTNQGSAAASRYLYTNTNFSSTNFTVIYIGKMNGGNSYRLLSSYNTNWLCGYHGGYQDKLFCNNWINNPSTNADANPHMYCVTSTGSSTYFYDYGNAIVSNSAIAASPPGQLATSGYINSIEFSNGDIAEILVYNRVLTTAERNQLEGYLAYKYSVSAPLASLQTYQTYAAGSNTVNLLATDQSANRFNGTTTATVNSYPGPVVTPTTTTPCGNTSVTFNLSGMAPAGNSLGTTAAAAYLNVSPNPVIGSNWTIQSWVQFPLANTGGAGNWNTLVRGTANHHIIFNNDGTNKYLGTYNSGFYSSGFNINQLSAGWHHIAAVGTGGSTLFYVDGVYVGKAAMQCTDNLVAIGNYQGGNQQMGQIDEFSIWNTALPQNTISNYMTQAITASHPNYANLVSYYKMDGNGNDSKGSSPGTLTSGATANTATAFYAYNVSNGIGGSLSPASGSTAESFTITNPSSNGTVSFTATKNSCNSAATSSSITVLTPPTANAGSAMSAICQGGTSAALGGSIGGAATSGTWSDGGVGGTFNPNATTLNATWTPPAAYSGTATLTLTASGGTCPNATASKTIVVGATPTVSTGSIPAICQGGSIVLSGSIGGSATGATWSDNGAGGSFSPNASTLNATYTPPSSFNGNITLTLTTSGGPCTAVAASGTLVVSTPIVAGTVSGAPAVAATGNVITYTASGYTPGAVFSMFQYQWNSTSGAWTNWGTTNPYNWTASNAGNTLYVRSVFVNGGCTAYSSPVSTYVINSSIGWTGASQPANTGFVPTMPACGNWSASWCAGSGTYTHLTLVKDIAYTVQNLGTTACGGAMSNAYLQAWYNGGSTSCSWGAIAYPGLNSVTFTAQISGDHIINVTTNPLSDNNACGGSTGWGGFGSSSAALQYRQSTTVTASVNGSSVCAGTNIPLIATLSGGGNNPTVTWSLISGGGSISGSTYIPGAYTGSVTARATVGVCTSDVTFTVGTSAPQAAGNITAGPIGSYCGTPLLADANITASSSCCGGGHEPYRGRLFNSTCSGNQTWASANPTSYGTEWWQEDLGSVKPVNGVATQGRSDFSGQRVTSYTVKLSIDGTTWFDVPGTFTANTDDNTVVTNWFGQYHARYVRIYPQSSVSHMSMRAEVLSIPEGSTSSAQTVYMSAQIPSGADQARWYTVASGGSPFSTAQYTSASITQNTTYYVEAYNTAQSCVTNATRTAVTVRVNDVYGQGNAAGPAGVGNTNGKSELTTWLNAGAINQSIGTNVSSWADASGVGNNATQASATLQPTLQTQSAFNNQNAVRFDGSNDYLTTTNFLNNTQKGYYDINTANTYTTMAVSKYGGTNGRVITSNTHNWLLGYWSNHTDAAYAEGWITGNSGSSCGNCCGFVTDNNAHLHSMDGNRAYTSFYKENGLAYAASCGVMSPGSIALGGSPTFPEYSNADVAEVINYNLPLNDARRNIVANYLAAKYGLTISNDMYTGDQTAGGDCDFNVSGVGRESSGVHEKGTSGGLYITTTVADYLQNNGDYIMFGHLSSTGGWETSDLVTCGTPNPSKRLSRVWYLQKTDVGSNGGNITLSFDLNVLQGITTPQSGTYRLMYRSGNSGNFAGAATGTISGSQIQFTVNASAISNGQFTLGYDADIPRAVSFTGASSNYVSVANNTTLQTSGDFTYEMWVKPTSFAAGNNTYFENGTWGGQTTLFRQDAPGTIALYMNSTSIGSLSYAPATGVWTHLALVRSGSTISLYANGTAVGNFTTSFNSATLPTTPMYIGASVHSSGSQNFNGLIDEFRLWNVARSATDIANNMHTTLTNSSAQWSNLQAYYKFDENFGKVFDLSKNNNNGDLVGANVTKVDLYTAGSSITGTNPVCQNATGVVYTISNLNSNSRLTYNWAVTGGTITAGQGTNAITVTWNTAGTQAVNVTVTHSNSCQTETATLPVTVNPPLPVSVTISASPSTPVCAGTNITFTATPTNGGSSPAYQWKKNGTDIPSATSSTYSSTGLASGDIITCVLTSNITPCATGNPATSTGITVTINPNQPVSVSIAASPTGTICPGTSVTFTATPTNGGSTPVFQWKKNGNVVGTNSATYTDNTLNNNDAIICILTSNATCATGSPATSNTITQAVYAPSAGGSVFSSQTICYNTPMADIGLVGNNGTVVKWQSSTDNFVSNVVDITNTTSILTGSSQGNLLQDMWYRAVVQNGTGCATANSANVKITVTPPAVGGTVASNQTICYSTPMADLSLSGYTGTIVKWQKSNDNFVSNIVDISNTSATLTGSSQGNLTQDTWFRAVVQISGSCPSANSSAVKITVTPPSVGGTVSSAQSICNGATMADLTLTGYTGTVVKWQKSNDNFASNIVDITNTTPTLTGTSQGAITQDTWFRAVVQNGSGCATSLSSAVKITILPGPDVSNFTTTNNGPVCAGGTAVVTLSSSTLASGTYTVTYDLGTPNQATGLTATVTFSSGSATFTTAALPATGTTTLTVTQVKNASNCTSVPGSGNVTGIVVNAGPTVSIANGADVCVGGQVTLSANVSGGAGTSTNFVWERSPNGVNTWSTVQTSAATTYATSTSLGVGTYYYKVSVTQSGAGCIATSANAVMDVKNDPLITLDPVDVDICAGGQGIFTANATGGTPALLYEWEYDDTNPVQNGTPTGVTYSGSTSNTLTLTTTGSTAASTTAYWVKVYATGSGCDATYSLFANFNVHTQPTVSNPTPPVQSGICVGGTVAPVSVTASGGVGAYSYQWYSNTSNSTSGGTTVGTNAASYTPASLVGTTYYYCVVSQTASGCGPVTTAATASVTTGAAVTATATVDECVNLGVTDKYYVLVSANGGTPPYTYNGAFYNSTSGEGIYEVNENTTGSTFTVHDANGCAATTAPVNTPVGHPTDIALASSTGNIVADCWDNNFNKWITFRDPVTNNAILAINDNQSNLGKVTVDLYKDATPPVIYNNGLATNCTWTQFTAMRRHFKVTTSVAPTSAVDLMLFFTDDEYTTLKADAWNNNTGYPNANYACTELDDVYNFNQLYVTKYTGVNEDGNYLNNQPSGLYRVFGDNTTPNLPLIKGEHTSNNSGFQQIYGGNATHHYVKLTVTEFSEFWLHGSQQSQALPVQMIYLQADAINNSFIRLTWATATEINNHGFEVERSTDGQTWNNIGWVDGHNNSTVQNNYSFDDLNVTAGVIYYYRLKQVDNDQQYEYTDIVSARLTGDISFSVFDFVPNPTNNQTNLTVTSAKDQEITVSFYNLVGQKVTEGTYGLNKGNNKIEFDLGKLASGTYTALIATANEVYSRKVVLTR